MAVSLSPNNPIPNQIPFVDIIYQVSTFTPTNWYYYIGGRCMVYRRLFVRRLSWKKLGFFSL